jgi:alkaline phosphatase D
VFLFRLTLFAVLFLPCGVRAADADRPLQRIAFGSCAHQDKPQPIWDAIAAVRPDLFLFIGDNIYADTQDMEVMKAKYQKLAEVPGYQKLLKTCPVLATWDDHDYGANDAGADYPKKVESQQLFLDFFGEPTGSPRRKRQGVYDARVFGPPGKRVQVILLDTRYHRSPLKKREKTAPNEGPYLPNSDPKATMLGEAQWKWLEEQLRVPAEVRLAVSSIQVVAEDHGWEKWMNLPHERNRLFQLIRATKAGGVVFLSGDRHLAELSEMDGGAGYPIYDLTASGLNQASQRWRKQEVNRHRVATMNFGNHFGLITIDWDQKDPRLGLQIRDEAGDVTIQQKLPLSVLQPGYLKARVSGLPRGEAGQPLTLAELGKRINEEITLTITVQATGTGSGLIFLNSAPDRRDEDNFTVVLDKAAVEAFKKAGVASPQSRFEGKVVRVKGKLSLFKDRAQIIVSDPKQIEIVEK